MRGSKAYWMLLAYLMILSIAMIMVYLFWWRINRESGGSFVVGRIFFQTLFYVQVGLVCLIAPGLTSGAITIEKEQRTYDLLAVTPMEARSMVIGKLISALSFVLLLMVSSVPLVSVCFLLGGVSPGEVLFAYLALLLTAFMYGALGLMWSSVARNTATATLMTYCTVFILFLGTLALVEADALKAVNPIGAFLYATNMEKYFSFSMPGWIPGLILNALAGILFMMVAIRKIDSYATDTSLGLRIQSLVLYFAVVFFVFGWLFGVHYPLGWMESDGELLMVIWLIVLTFLLILTPIFTTGELERDEQRGLGTFLSHGWKHLFRGRIESGIPFIVLLLAVSVLLFVLGFPIMGKKIPVEVGLDLPVLVILVLMVVAAFGAIELLLSSLLRSRWAALASGYLIMAILILLPLIVLPGSLRPEEIVGFKPLWIPLYLNPHMALMSLFPDVMPDLPDPASDIPFLCITTLVYALIGAMVFVKLRRVLAERHR